MQERRGGQPLYIDRYVKLKGSDTFSKMYPTPFRRRIYFLNALAACIMAISRKTTRGDGIDVACGTLVGSVQAADRAKFMPDNYVAMSGYGELFTVKFPNSQEACYLRQAHKCCGN